MKPNEIFHVMNLAEECLEKGQEFVPLFVGAPGVAKSHNVKAWAKRKGYNLIDIRLAYLEQPDFIGLPLFKEVEGRDRTVYSLPEFWPSKDERVVLFFDEPNRGTNAIMNGIMQVLTDRKIHLYQLPKNCLIVAAINPEDGNYEVNTMDTALKDRFVPYEIEYDKKDFIEYMKSNNWNKHIIAFVESGAWSYVKPENLSGNAGTKYISPRTLEKLNFALNSKSVSDVMYPTLEGVLGKAVATDFFAFITNERPVTFSELVNKSKEALARLEVFSDPKAFKNVQISITIRDLLDNVTDEKFIDVLKEVCKIIPSNSAHPLITDAEIKLKKQPNELLKELIKDKEVKSNLKRII